MSSTTQRPIYLLVYRNAKSSRAHFALFVPNAIHATTSPHLGNCQGTIIHVIGTPMNGFAHEFKRNYNTGTTQHLKDAVILGYVTSAHLPESPTTNLIKEDKALGQMDAWALQVQPPRASANFMGPVDGVQNRRCQEWTMSYLQHLVKKGLVTEQALELAQQRRDPPEFGVGLKNVAASGGARG